MSEQYPNEACRVCGAEDLPLEVVEDSGMAGPLCTRCARFQRELAEMRHRRREALRRWRQGDGRRPDSYPDHI